MKSLLCNWKVMLAVIGLFIFGYVEVWGADWKLYGKDGYYDAASITRQPDGSIRVWTKWVLHGEKMSSEEA